MSTAAKLPLARYAADQLYVSLILVASFVLLPRTTFPFTPARPLVQQTSLDRPEHPFLTPLTAQPLKTMLLSLLGTAACMLWWCQRLKGWWRPNDISLSKDERVRGSIQASSGAPQWTLLTRQAIKDAFVATSIATAMLTLLLFGLGAPVNQHFARTFALALHLALLLAWPPIHALGLPSVQDRGLADRVRMTRLLCELRTTSSLEMSIVYPFAGAFLGAWIGVAPIPLDWDRPWQSWPLTPAFGSLVGFIIGGILVWAQTATVQLLDPGQIDTMTPATNRTGKRKAKKA